VAYAHPWASPVVGDAHSPLTLGIHESLIL